MSFTAECPFCRLMVRGIPGYREGDSLECPGCKSHFTLVAMANPRVAKRVIVAASAAAKPADPVSTTTELKTLLASVGEAESQAKSQSEDGQDAALGRAARPVNPFGVASFFCSTFALFFASIPPLGILVLPLAGAGMVLGCAGVSSRTARQRGMLLSVAGLAVSVPVLVLAGLQPEILGLPPRYGETKLPANTQTVYHVTRDNIPQVGPKESDWVDASQDAVQQAGMRVRVAAVEIRPVTWQDSQGRKHSTSRCLAIKLRISNTGVDQFVDYKSWARQSAADEGAGAVLRDNLGRSYRQKNFGPDALVAGHVPHASLPLAKWVDDILVFDAPATSIEYLRLELSCAAFGAPGKFQLQIPRRLITNL